MHINVWIVKFSPLFPQATNGKLKMEFKKFNVEYGKDCQKRDYLFVGKIQKYTKVNTDVNFVLCILFFFSKMNNLYILSF